MRVSVNIFCLLYIKLTIFVLGGFSWYINFNCHEDFSYVQLKAEDTCSMSADYYTREACHIFISSHSTTTTLIVVCVIVLLVTVLISVYCYIRHVRRKYRLISEKRNVPVYLKVIAKIACHAAYYIFFLF